jgi:CheY-like chemotaxis protein
MNEPRQEPPSLVSCRIVVADDNADVAESLAMILRLEGHDVTVVGDGDAAIQAIEAIGPDIAMLDIGMPGLDGYEIARRVRQQLRIAITLVAVTGWGQESDRARALEAGFDHHFTKPVEPDVLTELCKTPRRR